MPPVEQELSASEQARRSIGARLQNDEARLAFDLINGLGPVQWHYSIVGVRHYACAKIEARTDGATRLWDYPGGSLGETVDESVLNTFAALCDEIMRGKPLRVIYDEGDYEEISASDPRFAGFRLNIQ